MTGSSGTSRGKRKPAKKVSSAEKHRKKTARGSLDKNVEPTVDPLASNIAAECCIGATESVSTTLSSDKQPVPIITTPASERVREARSETTAKSSYESSTQSSVSSGVLSHISFPNPNFVHKPGSNRDTEMFHKYLDDKGNSVHSSKGKDYVKEHVFPNVKLMNPRDRSASDFVEEAIHERLLIVPPRVPPHERARYVKKMSELFEKTMTKKKNNIQAAMRRTYLGEPC